ncbi:hypothetical protein RRG08_014871 [Elysia crispata]|uniref:Uncharacterized protein n=1 Tax=Elysia crispata TaxID=231223 RepID=A0AAE1AM99_9GAST|nr:hypothetical protein RRG08_014871 [Elysia crispata]
MYTSFPDFTHCHKQQKPSTTTTTTVSRYSDVVCGRDVIETVGGGKFHLLTTSPVRATVRATVSATERATSHNISSIVQLQHLDPGTDNINNASDPDSSLLWVDDGGLDLSSPFCAANSSQRSRARPVLSGAGGLGQSQTLYDRRSSASSFPY